jgi:hypothetical protein
MKKNQIEEILFTQHLGGKPIFQFRASKDGSLQRTGIGVPPSFDLSVSTTQDPASIFEQILEIIPEHLPATNLYGAEVDSAEVMEYQLSFYGEKQANGQWNLKSGIRILADTNTPYAHPLLPVVAMIGKQAERSTAELYFDAMIYYAFGARSGSIPDTTTLSGPKIYSEKQRLFADYIQALHNESQFTGLLLYGKSQTYTDSNNTEYLLESFHKDNAISVHLVPSGVRRNKMPDRTISQRSASTVRTPATAAASEGLALQIITMLTSMRVVFFILMLACIVYLTFYL